jgi:phage tail-like protein
LIDACLPPGSGLAVRSRTANDLDALPYAAWYEEPQPVMRAGGSELPYLGRQDGYDTWELLFQRAQGRYLQLELTLFGNGQASPHVRALRAYYPRFSYLANYLPAVYRQDEPSASFFERFLANFEGVLTTLEDRIAAVQVLFDARTAPNEALDWLAGWFGVALDGTWEEARRRLWIRNAMLFFRKRGTLGGLHMALDLAFGECVDERVFTTPLAGRSSLSGIRIVEQYRTRHTPGVILGDPTDGGGLQLASRGGATWLPRDGGDRLQVIYAAYRTAKGLEAALPPAFSPVEPQGSLAAAAWRRFTQEVMRFVPSVSADHAALWQEFLTRRYQTIAALNDAYELPAGARFADFAVIQMPQALPTGSAALQDWYQFQAVVLPMRRAAHRFSVLLPKPRRASVSQAELLERLTLARRVIDLEKPAHTTYEVKHYWAMFRLGQVRLGYDTVVELGSRSPELITPLVLGQSYLLESYLDTAHVAPASRSFVTGDHR